MEENHTVMGTFGSYLLGGKNLGKRCRLLKQKLIQHNKAKSPGTEWASPKGEEAVTQKVLIVDFSQVLRTIYRVGGIFMG